MKDWAIVYDISDNRNRQKVARILRSVGFHIQRSTFYITDMSKEEIESLTERLKPYVNPKTDRLFVYPVEELELAEGYIIKPWEVFIL